MKRPAETQLQGEFKFGTGQPPSSTANPFAGISLSAAAPLAASLFTAAAASNATGGGFAFSASSGAASDATAGADAKPVANPFMGLSLFSTSSGLSGGTTAGAASTSANPFSGLSLFSSPASGGFFTAAAESLQHGKNETAAVGFSTGASLSGASTSVSEPKDQQVPVINSSDLPSISTVAAGKVADEAASAASVDARGDATGEEDEEMVFHAECKLWKLGRGGPGSSPPTAAGALSVDRQGDGADAKTDWQWQERGSGVVHINRHRKTGAGRLVMRMRGVLKLLLNTPVFPTTKYEKVGQKSVRFVGVDTDESRSSDSNADVKDDQVNMCAFRLNLQSNDQQGKFLTVMRDVLGVTSAAA